ncbi:MAG: hypothetical protein V1839_02600 [archaeon]
MQTVRTREGAVKLIIPKPEYPITAKSPAFYNPEMILNRDISVLIAKLTKRARALDLLSATGIRALRLAKEAGAKEVWANDAKKSAFEMIEKNIKLNKLKIRASNMYADKLLAKSHEFDYIDIDPFGTPVPFVEDAVRKLSKDGILAVTATDTAVLCGSAGFKCCLSRYGGKPIRNHLMHEVGLRILIAYVVKTGLKHKVNLVPIFSNSTRHYMRVYFKTTKTRENLIGLWQGSGPMWLGGLWDNELVENLYDLAQQNEFVSKATKELLFTIREESKVHEIGFIDIASFHPKNFPRISDVIAKLQAKGYKAARTHFNPTGIRTDASQIEVKKIVT